ncbi:SusC/RagA family TonB-linked outer membrane protein [Carboxylicivirga marina]|uniref:TonB-dependent receptor n=1 Tax=Carboxylicivirga marina TaxID=2800988 RepID=A0ABS1HIM3_9BACT|nr:TonB-dependent receptor [Carboxylicivirga marina]MBK3517499.1 TonB-dependent receptor [Carboxylicivirga marina]
MKKLFKKLLHYPRALTALILVFTTIQISGQNIVVKGNVSDEDGESLPGVNIVIKGTVTGVITDMDGNYNLTGASQSDVLVFSFIGMETQEILVGSQTVINVTLKSGISLEEVIAVGYGSVRKSDLTGSVASIRTEDIVKSGAATLEQALAGRMAGVQIQNSDNAPGAGLEIRIRGNNSINASSAPLYVIDGFPIEGSSDEATNLSSTGMSPLSGIDPSDIESIDVLKDASATAIYGARGANGVVIIKTKSGKSGKLTVDFSASGGVQQMIQKYDMMDNMEYARMRHNRIYKYPDTYGNEVDETIDANAYFKDWETFKDSTNTRWIDEVSQPGIIQNYNLSTSGGNAKTNYLASVSYYNNKGVVKHTEFERITTNFKIFSDVNSFLKLGINSRMSYSVNDGTVSINSTGSANYAGVLQQALRASPLLDVNATAKDLVNNDDDIIYNPNTNPLVLLEEVDMLRKEITNYSNAFAEFNLLPGLKFKALGGLSLSYSKNARYFPSYTSWGDKANGSAGIQNQLSTRWLSENTLSYFKKLGKHRINALAGTSYQSTIIEQLNVENSNFPIETLGIDNIGVGEAYGAPNSSKSSFALGSYFGRINYNYADRYLITATMRTDGSSKFADGKKWGNFPSLAFAWRASEESFIKNLGIFDNLKIRAGWGLTGNPNIPPYMSMAGYNLIKYPSASNLATGIYPTRTGNPNLTWETTESTNVGIDMGFINNKINVTVDAYLKRTTDLLLDTDIGPSTGYAKFLYNSGQVNNKGLEIAINTVNFDRKFKWFTDFNIAFNRNEIVDLGSLATSDWMYVPGTKNYDTAILKEGEEIGLWYGYKNNGIWQQDEFEWDGSQYILKPIGTDENGNNIYPAVPSTAIEPGMRKYMDLSGPDGKPDGEINSYDMTIIGRSQPKHFGGINNRFEYKGFDMSIFMEWSYGREVFNANNLFLIDAFQNYNHLDADYWSPIIYELDENGLETSTVVDPGNPDGIYPEFGKSSYGNDTHDAFIEDASYLRIKSINFGYNFNKQQLKKLNIEGLRIYCNLLNMHTFTNYSGYDPNANSNTLKGLRPGYDFSSYPLARTIMLGLNIKL